MKLTMRVLMGWLLLCGWVTAAEVEPRSVNAQEFAKLAAQPDTVLLDVRTAREVKVGIIKGATAIDFYAADFEQAVGKLDRAKTCLVYCASGVRSAKACKKMLGLGFKNVVNLNGGIMGWQKAGLPVEKPAAPAGP